MFAHTDDKFEFRLDCKCHDGRYTYYYTATKEEMNKIEKDAIVSGLYTQVLLQRLDPNPIDNLGHWGA